ncbi:MAG: antibiotic biosynthesis monooxygenase [Acidobacteriota bacterium]
MSLKLHPAPDRVDEVVRALGNLLGPTKVQPGCVECGVYQETGNPGGILYQEQWSSWKHLEAHLKSDRFARILELMEVSTDPPELTFHGIHEIRGIEYVHEVRGTRT